MTDRIRQRDRPEPADMPEPLRGPPDSGHWLLLGRYEVRRRLAANGAIATFEGVDRQSRSAVLIQRATPPAAHAMAATLERFKALTEFRHANVPTLFDAGLDGEGVVLVSEHVEGDLLSELLPASGPLDADTAVDLISQICDALAAAHEAGLECGELSPERILITESGDPVLLGLGCTDLFSTNGPDSATTPRRRSEINSLGAVVYQMVTGESPRAVRPERIPEALRDAVLRALSSEPESGFATATALAASLQSSLRGAVSGRKPTEAIQPAPAAPAASSPTEPVLADESFRGWYRRKFHAQPALVQALLWTGLGFAWIPAWYLATRPSAARN